MAHFNKLLECSGALGQIMLKTRAMGKLLLAIILIVGVWPFTSMVGAQQQADSDPGGRKILMLANSTCEYEYVRTDDAEKVVNRVHSHARCFDEPLGNGVVLRMIEIPEGSFLMGSPESESGRSADEGPQHEEHVRRFFLGQFEVTEGQYEAMSSRPRVRRSLDGSLSEVLGRLNPTTAADGISWKEAEEFCARLKALTGKSYRLPSEAEWEYAARAGSTTAFEYGPVFVPEFVNNGNWKEHVKMGEKGTVPLPVGTSGPPNAFGLFDIEGNVSEWVQDLYHPTYNGAPADGSAWLDRHASVKGERVMRGGDYGNRTEFLRSAAREHWDPGMWPSGFGFRVALSEGSGEK
jgi:formylglycine-generating enzyme required for sulfatase activity